MGLALSELLLEPRPETARGVTPREAQKWASP